MPKITFMGAGSTVFAKNVLGDSMMTPALAESTIALYDIDAQRLQDSRMMLENINRNNGGKATIQAFLGVEQRKAALQGASFVVTRSRSGCTSRAPSPTLRCPRSTACARPSPIPWASAASSARCAPSP